MGGLETLPGYADDEFRKQWYAFWNESHQCYLMNSLQGTGEARQSFRRQYENTAHDSILESRLLKLINKTAVKLEQIYTQSAILEPNSI